MEYVPQLSAKAVPDWIAGFIYGMTGDNHLHEIEACWNGSTSTVRDAEKLIKDVEAHNWARAGLHYKVFRKDLADGLTSCKNMQDDFQAIEDWAQIFTEPKKLSETVAKRYALHRKTIKKDIDKEEADWSSGKYFDAGVDSAMALTELVGPIETAEMYGSGVGMPLLAAPEFVAGFLFGITGENNLTEIEACWTGGESLAQEIEVAIVDLEKADFTDAIAALGQVVDQFPAELFTCEHMGDDVRAIEKWASIFTNKTELIATVTKHYLLHKKAIKADIASTRSDWANGSYFSSGMDAADLLTIAIGPIQSPTIVSDVSNSILEIPEFAAGLVYGFTGDNNLTELQACFTGGEVTLGAFETALSEFEAGNIIKATKDAKVAMADFQADMATCHNMGDDIAAIESWAQIFTEPTKLIETAGKNWLLHKRAIKKDIAAEKADWAIGHYFKAGEDTADALVKLLGQVN